MFIHKDFYVLKHIKKIIYSARCRSEVDAMIDRTMKPK